MYARENDSASIPALSIVAPCFNEQACLAEFVRRARAAANVAVGEEYEIVLVDDGSKDRTWEVIKSFAEVDARLVAIRLSRNFGHQRALSAGLYNCRGRRILMIDADLQDPPELVGEMMALLDAGADVVYGQRRVRSGETRMKTKSAKLFYRVLSRLIEIDIPLDTGDFRLIRRRVLDVLQAMPEEARFVRGLVSWIGMTQVPIVYDRDPRLAGDTGYTFGRMVRLAIDAITGFSVVPLRVASYSGMVTAVGSVLMLSYTIGSWLLGRTVNGWTSLASIILLLGSVQLMVLGVMGEYLGRLFMQSKGRPLFVVQDIYRRERDSAVSKTNKPDHIVKAAEVEQPVILAR
jgi:glycosyltransferase involved in cell wall biosynthesis